jgi:hypothetical protein
MLDTTEKLMTIQDKINAISQRLDAERIYDESCSACYKQRSFLRELIDRQSFYAQCVKLITLFSIAVAHLIYMQPFLDAYSAMEDYSNRIIYKYPNQPTYHGLDTRVLKKQFDVLDNYKKNVWMTIGTMCVALSTSCFFLFILPITNIKKCHLVLMRIIDIIAFAALTALLLTRSLCVENFEPSLSTALISAQKLAPADRLMNTLQCSIHFRENLSFCSEVIAKSVFPSFLIKYLLVLAILTLAYLLLAYIIDWCIKHWIPHAKEQTEKKSYNKTYIPVYLPATTPGHAYPKSGRLIHA